MEIGELREKIENDLEIDPVSLDDAALETPKLYSRYLNLLSQEGLVLKQIMIRLDELKLERWKFYMGKQTDAYYAKHPLHEKVIKTDVEKYLSADPILGKAKMLLEEQQMKVKMIEDAMKQISNRSFQIRDAIEWRKFQMGA